MDHRQGNPDHGRRVDDTWYDKSGGDMFTPRDAGEENVYAGEAFETSGKYCGACGERNGEDEEWCQACGTRLRGKEGPRPVHAAQLHNKK